MGDTLAKILQGMASGAQVFSGISNAFGSIPQPTQAPIPGPAEQLNTIYNPQPLGQNLYENLTYQPKPNNLGGIGNKLGKGLIKYG